jgi:prepilin-type N-terminal cleavage/methylation domain-containing protein
MNKSVNSQQLTVDRQDKTVHRLLSTVHHKGFTLIELLVVVTIIGILIAAGIYSWQAAQVNGRDNKKKNDLKTIQSALETYKNNLGHYPKSPGAGGSDPWDPDWQTADCGGNNAGDPFIPALDSTYISQIPKDKNITFDGSTMTTCSYLYFGYPPNGVWGCTYEYYLLAAYMEKPQPAANRQIPDCYNYGPGDATNIWSDPRWYVVTSP